MHFRTTRPAVLLLALAACAGSVKQESFDLNLPLAGFPYRPETEEDIKRWFFAAPKHEAGTLALEGDVATAELPLGSGDDFDRVKFILRKDPLRVVAVQVWPKKGALPEQKAFRAYRAGTPLYATGKAGEYLDLKDANITKVLEFGIEPRIGIDTWEAIQLRLAPLAQARDEAGLQKELAALNLSSPDTPVSVRDWFADATLRYMRKDRTLGVFTEGELPDFIFVKTPTQTFDRDHYFALKDGKIWRRKNPNTTGDLGGAAGDAASKAALENKWELFGDGLPAPADPKQAFDRPTKIVEISSDGDDLLALDDRGRFYLRTTASTSLTSVDDWSDGWGFPDKVPFVLPDHAKGYRAWNIGRRAEHALFYTDPVGNPHHFGTMGTTTVYLLDKEGQRIKFTDNGLPADFSRDIGTPDRGRFIAENLSASASAIMLIDRYGRIFTRFEDYDINGGATMFISYTFKKERRPDDKPDDMQTNYTPHALPLMPWKWHAPIPVEGKTRLTKDITILQTGQGNAARELRVAAFGPDGSPGYFAKGIDEETWTWHAAPVPVRDERLLADADVKQGAEQFTATKGDVSKSSLPRGPGADARYGGVLQVGAGKDAKVLEAIEVQLLDFNPWTSPATLRITGAKGASIDLFLHTTDLWTPRRRNQPGFDGTPLLQYGTLEIPAGLLSLPPGDVRAALVKPFLRTHLETFKFVVRFLGNEVDVRSNESGSDRAQMLSLKFMRLGGDAPVVAPKIENDTFSFMEEDGFANMVADKKLILDNISTMGVTDIPAIEAVIKANEDTRVEMARLLKMQDKSVSSLERLASAAGAFGNVSRFLGIDLIPGLANTRKYIPSMLAIQSESGKLLLLNSQKNWQLADEELGARITMYQSVLKRLQEKQKREGRGM